MNETPTLLIAGGADTERAVLSKWPGARVGGTFRDLSLLEYVAAGMRPDLVVIDPSLSPRGESLEAWADRFRGTFPSVSVIVFDGSTSKGTRNEGAMDTGEGAKVLTSQTVVVWSPKGGVGKTFLATNLACAAAIATRGNAVLIDMDLCSGDVAVHLDLLDGPTITELIPVLPDTRPEGLDKFAQRHGPSGLNVICGPRQVELCDLVTPEVVKSVLSLASKRWGLTYVDTAPDMTSDIVGECVDAASKVVLVATQDVAALKQCRSAIEIFTKLGIPASSMAVVVNRASKDSLMPLNKVEEFLGVDLAGAVPDDRKLAERSVFEGRPLALSSKNEVSEAIWSVLNRLSPGLGRTPKGSRISRRKGLFW